MKHGFERYCKNYQNIENYEKAKKDNFIGWECHHRLETHNSDGIRRDVDISHKELEALGMYYNRPPEELIFLTIREHHILRKVSDSTREKLRATKKGENNPNYGKHLSEETKQKIGEANKGKPKSEETRKKMREAKKGENNPAFGKHWFNNGKINKRVKECPKGFVPGRLK